MEWGEKKKMNCVYPNYYKYFQCIGGKCLHNCCIGWEIDVDEKTFKNYSKKNDCFSKKLMKKIKTIDDIRYIELDENKRCPFLNEENLCEIIIHYSESELCEICSLHPRCRNFFSNTVETLLGMCCEEAAKIILSYPGKTQMVGEYDINEDEKLFLEKRNSVLQKAQDRKIKFEKRMEILKKSFNIDFNFERFEVYKNLERLDRKWDEMLEKLKGENNLKTEEFNIAFEQMFCYFFIRHSFEIGIENAAYFSILSCEVISKILANSQEISFASLVETARMYSCEVEYSDENIDEILSYF